MAGALLLPLGPIRHHFRIAVVKVISHRVRGGNYKFIGAHFIGDIQAELVRGS